jgi:glutaconate CoA-transferase subunit A
MRAASFGIPFQPVGGLDGSDIPAASGFARIQDPYSEQWVYAIPAIRPDWALVQVPVADARGNARIVGTPFWDRILSRAARRVIVVAEALVPTEELARQPELTVVPELFVEAVVHLPGGAHPTSCPPCHEVDDAAVWRYLELSASPSGLERYLEETRAADHALAAR